MPEHAAVSATVDAAALLGCATRRGLVNAVLRRFQRERQQLDARRSKACPRRDSRIPTWLIEALRADHPDAWQRILDANNAAPPLWLRVNLRERRARRITRKLAAAGLGRRRGRTSTRPCCLRAASSSRCRASRAGEVSVQDVCGAARRGVARARAGPARARRLRGAGRQDGAHPRSRRAAAARCGPSTAMPTRLASVRENLDRLGLAAKLVAGDATRPDAWWDGRPFDRILIDAPCSATGVIRRHPDIKVLRRPRRRRPRRRYCRRACCGRSGRLLAPGGRLVYATCSVLAARERGRRSTAFRADGAGDRARPRVWRRCRLLPEEAGGDGFYYAWLEKPDVLRAQWTPPQQ